MGWFSKRNNRTVGKRRLQKLIKGVFNKVFKETKSVFFVKSGYDSKETLMNKYSESKKYEKFVTEISNKIGKLLVNQNRLEWKKYYLKAKKNKSLKLPPYITFEQDILKKITENSYKFIQSIPHDILELNKLKYVQTLQESVLTGKLGRGELEKLVKELGSKYSKLIARTETSRLQTAVIETRAKKLNCKVYVWDSANDRRTRESHRKMKGVIVPWYSEQERKPHLDGMYGHAGEFPNCRCGTEPVFDESDLPYGAVLKFYDWQRKKVVNVKRKDLLDNLDLNKGENDE